MSDPKKGPTDEEKRALLRALRDVDPADLERARESLGDAASYLEEIVNGFPAAQKFLRMRGATRVGELTREQLKELEEFISREWFGKRPN